MSNVTQVRRTEPKLRELFANDFAIGAAVNSRTLVSQQELLTYHFNSLTAENEMKVIRIHPEEGRYTFEEADQMIAFARQHGFQVRGHTLVWHNAADWMYVNPDGSLVNREKLLSRMKEHIDTVVGRYKNDIFAWDVVNEAVEDKGDSLLRNSKWLEIVGESFIAKAFEYAHEADPNAQLFYNDYNECDPVKRDKIYTLVKSLKEQGVPIHGIGLQAHWDLWSPTIDEIRAAIEKYASLDLRLHVTELDLSVYSPEDLRDNLTAPTEEMLELQAKRYEDIFRVFREYRSHIDSVTFWGSADDYTWLDYFREIKRKNWPFLFDVQHAPKDSFWRVAELAKQA